MLVSIDRTIPLGCARVHGITNEMLVGQPPIGERRSPRSSRFLRVTARSSSTPGRHSTSLSGAGITVKRLYVPYLKYLHPLSRSFPLPPQAQPRRVLPAAQHRQRPLPIAHSATPAPQPSSHPPACSTCSARYPRPAPGPDRSRLGPAVNGQIATPRPLPDTRHMVCVYTYQFMNGLLD